jgi:tetratricopeptide (TPR) repeat protein
MRTAYPSVAPTSWTQKFTGVFSSKSPQAAAKSQAEQSKLDPTSLGFASGPPNAALFLSMAQLSDRGGNTPHAREMYRSTLSLEPQNLEALLGLARLEDREGNLPEAASLYQQAVAIAPQDARALNDLGLCFARSGQLDFSLQALSAATRIQPTKPLYRNNIAKVLVELNRLGEAAAELAAAHPPAAVEYNMAVLLEQRGRTAEAVPYLVRATQIDPQFGPAAELLVQLSPETASIAQAASPEASNDDILPTPQNSADNADPAENAAVAVYPNTGMAPNYNLPAQTARVPVMSSPELLPPVRQ